MLVTAIPCMVLPGPAGA